MAKPIQELLTKSKVNFPAKVYLLAGDEEYFIDEVVALAEKNIIPEQDASFNKFIYFGKDITLENLRSVTKQGSFMGGRMLFIVKEAHSITGLEKPGSDKVMANIFKELPENNCLIMAFKGKKMAKTTLIYKSLEATGQLFISEKLREKDILSFISNELKNAEVKFDGEVPKLLFDLVGTDLYRISNEIGKLAMRYANSSITKTEVYSSTGVSKDYNVFELQTAIGNKNITRVNDILLAFSRNTKDHPVIKEVSMLSGFAIKMLNLKYIRMAGASVDIVKEIGIPPFKVQEFEGQVNKYSVMQLEKMITALLKADSSAKGVGDPLQEEENYLNLVIELNTILA